MRARSSFASRLAHLFVLGLSVVAFSGCEKESSRPEALGESPWTTDPEIYTYCKDHCAAMSCSDAGTGYCQDYCEFWLSGFDTKCGDEVRANLECTEGLSCDDFTAYSEDPLGSKCKDAYAAEVSACSTETVGCADYCELAIECDPEFDTFCVDSCNLQAAWFEEYYSAECKDASDALNSCAAELTCGDLDLMRDSDYTPPECEDERAAFDAACKK